MQELSTRTRNVIVAMSIGVIAICAVFELVTGAWWADPGIVAALGYAFARIVAGLLGSP